MPSKVGCKFKMLLTVQTYISDLFGLQCVVNIKRCVIDCVVLWPDNTTVVSAIAGGVHVQYVVIAAR